MQRAHPLALAIATAFASGSLAFPAPALGFTWSTVVNNSNYVPACGAVAAGEKLFNSYSQPSVNAQGIVAFRGRSKGSDGGSTGNEIAAYYSDAAAAVAGEPARGVFMRNAASGGPVTTVMCVGGAVPQPSNTDFNGAPASFNEFPAFPRIDAASPSIATRGQSLPVWVYPIGVDLTTQVGTSGVYTNSGGVLTTGASLLGAVVEFPDTALKFPQYSVPGATTPGTRFDQFPGAASIVDGSIIGFKGNYTEGDIGRTGVYFRNASQAGNPTYLVANSFTRIPNQPEGGTTNFGSTAPPSLAGGYLYFVGSDIEEAPTLGGIYRGKLDPAHSRDLEVLVGIGAQVPGEAPGTGFRMFGEGLSVSPDGNYVSFWGTWGSDAVVKTLYCPADGNTDLLAYCNTAHPSGFVVSIPVHQGIFVYDVRARELFAVAKTGEDGLQDFLFWVFSGAPPGVGGTEDTTREPPRWRSSAFAAVSLTSTKGYSVAFKAMQDNVPGIFLRKRTTPLTTVVKMLSPGQELDPMAPLNSIVTAVGIERDGFRGSNLALTASMLFESIEESIGWAGIYMTQVPLTDAPEPPARLLAMAGNAQAMIVVTPPVLDGGSPITGYSATCSPGGATASAKVSPIVVTGLDNGTAYNCTATATNALGTSRVSAASNTFTPVGPPPVPQTVQFSAATASVSEGVASIVVSVTRAGSTAGPASVMWSTADGTAIAGSDYTASSGSLEWAAGDSAARTITIPISPDAAIEGNEVFYVGLGNPVGLAVGTPAAIAVTITDDDSGVSFAQPAYTVAEGAPAISVAVNRNGSAASALSVTWSTADGTANAGQDFGTPGSGAQRSGVLSWGAGDATPKTITVGLGGTIPVINDTAFEESETFTIALSNPPGSAALAPPLSTTVTIVDDESVIQFAQATISVSEAGPNVVLPVVRGGSLAAAQSVTYTPSAGTAALITDFTGTAGTLTFAPGENVKLINLGPVSSAAPYIAVANDAAIEGPETFSITLSAPTAGAILGNIPVATVTIDSDDRGVTMDGMTFSVAENGGTAGIPVNRSGSPSGAVSVNYAFTNGTAVNGTHFTGTPGSLSWADGDTATKFITVPIIDDGTVNANRTFMVMLSGAAGASIGTPSTTTVTIQDNDNTVQFGAATATIAEGAGTLTVNVSRLGGTTGAASVTWTTADGTALSGSDFGTAGNPSPVGGVLNWAAGDSAAKTVVIPIIDDGVVEGAKTFTVSLASPTGTTLGAIPTLNVTLNDNDAGVVFAQSAYLVGEVQGNAVLTLNRTGPATSAATVTWTTANVTATAGQDFGTLNAATQRTGTVTWPAGDSAAKTITIPILNDALTEGTESFTVALSNPSSGIVLGSPSTATITIADDETPPDSVVQFSADKTFAVEGAGPAVLTVTRTGTDFLNPATVNYATQSGSAMAAADYTTMTGTLAWGAGDSAPKQIIVPITSDAIAEGPEQFFVQLSGVSAGSGIGGNAKATVLVLDEDEAFPLASAMPAGWTVPAAASAGWHVTNDPGSYAGAFALKTDQIDDNETAQIEVTQSFVAGTASFYVRVSSEGGFDFLRFYVDGVKAGEWSGVATTGWQLANVPIPAGVHTLRWSYEKDGSAFIGQDAAWLDGVVLPPAGPV